MSQNLEETVERVQRALQVLIGAKQAYSFEAYDAPQTIRTFREIVADAGMDTSLSPQQKVDAISAAAAEMQQRLQAAGAEADDVYVYLIAAVDGFAAEAQRIVDGPGSADAKTRLTDAELRVLLARIDAVVNEQGLRKPTAGLMMSLGAAKQRYGLAQLWQTLGLSGAEVADALANDGTKAAGTSRARLYQRLERGTTDDQRRVLEAVRAAAQKRGRKDREVMTLAEMFCPDLASGQKAAGAGPHPAAAYVGDLVRRGQRGD